MKTNNNISNPVPMSAKTKLASGLPNAARIADFGNRQGRASISGLNRIKRVILWLVGIIGAILGLVLWVFLRPIFRGVGWVISLATALMIIFWLLTL